MDENGHELLKKRQFCTFAVRVESEPFDAHAFVMVMTWAVGMDVRVELWW